MYICCALFGAIKDYVITIYLLTAEIT